MDKELLDFQKNALLGNISGQPLCSDYKAAWRSCGNDKEMLVRLALSQQSLPFLSHACYTKMGVTKDYIVNNFGEFINGNRVFSDVEGVKGYTYELYVGHRKPFDIKSDVIAMMWCDCDITMPKTKCGRIYVSNGSTIHLSLDGYNSPSVYLFDDSKVIIDDADEDSTVTVFKYSDKASVEIGKYCFAKVNQFTKKLKL